MCTPSLHMVDRLRAFHVDSFTEGSQSRSSFFARCLCGSGSGARICFPDQKVKKNSLLVFKEKGSKQCCGSVTYWDRSESGSSDPYFSQRIRYPNPDPATFVSDHQEGKKYSCIYIIFHRWKGIKKLHNSRNKGFSSFYCLMIEGSESVPLTNGSRSGSGRATNIWILRIRIFGSVLLTNRSGTWIRILPFSSVTIKKAKSTCTFTSFFIDENS